MILPRIMIVYREALQSLLKMEALFDYIEHQEAHCDDILLSVALHLVGKVRPMKIQLPAGSIIDYWKSCRGFKEYKFVVTGLASSRGGKFKNRNELRTDCSRYIRKRTKASLGLDAFHSNNSFSDVVDCTGSKCFMMEEYNEKKVVRFSDQYKAINVEECGVSS